MIMGTWAGGFAAWKWGPWEGLMLGVIAGAVLGLVHAVATVRFNVDHVISGVAINIFAQVRPDSFQRFHTTRRWCCNCRRSRQRSTAEPTVHRWWI